MIRNVMDISAVTFHEVDAHDPSQIDALVRMFVEVFPEDRRYTAYIRERACRAAHDDPLTIKHQWIVECEGKYVGFRVFSYMRRHNFGYSGYVGVLRPYRGQGIGRWIHQQTIEQIKADAMAEGQPPPIGFCGELDHPMTAPNERERQIRERRVEIFQRLGTILLDVDYYEPIVVQGMPLDDEQSLLGVEPDPMLLYLTPFQPDIQLAPEQIADIVVGVLVDGYRLSEDSWYVRRALESIR